MLSKHISPIVTLLGIILACTTQEIKSIKNNKFVYCVFMSPLYNLLFFWPRCVACGILVPQPGKEPVPPAVEVWSINHRTAREVLVQSVLKVL